MLKFVKKQMKTTRKFKVEYLAINTLIREIELHECEMNLDVRRTSFTDSEIIEKLPTYNAIGITSFEEVNY